ncbi:class I SAM-dependent methyltransferase [Romboutsia maritimum]|uniref:Class I SAM-dependent methyltransferase n=1 Tax=Romboutsia maritimum TaxID=2020948 RepID=A0A371IUJ4_9FIRM|nr:class I SAM-dependent methyltransferase [Romboutsia maritimum]RDY24160.1 class I SAM-dependent methyltransferase [Romboutsia maritimum]
MDLINRIEKYWTERSDEFCNLRISEINSNKRNLWIEVISKNLPQDKKLRILDVGTGTGFLAILMASLGHDVVGIDLTEAMINGANKTSHLLNYNIDFKVMDAQNLSFEDNYFDVVISRNLTWTLPDVKKAYKEWYRVLKHNGRLLNFDGDYGQVSFSNQVKTLDANHAHVGIKNSILKECDDIKNNLDISMQARPKWDTKILNQIGFSSCKIDNTISEKIYSTQDEFCNPTKMFGIYAIK